VDVHCKQESRGDGIANGSNLDVVIFKPQITTSALKFPIWI